MFTEWLSYDDGPGTPLYNGSISSISWQSGNEDFRRGYKFDYDGMGRLLTGKYGEGVRLSDNTDRYTERVTGYDLNGSITGLQRYGKRDDSSFGLIDDLTVELDGNRVTCVTDRLANLQYNNAFEFHDEQGEEPEYTYDDCGSLTSDYNSGISSVEYDNIGMPRLIRFSKGSSTEYIYSATGDKLCVKYSTTVRDILLPRDSLIQRPVTPIIGTLSFDRNNDNFIAPSIRDSFILSQEKRYIGETVEYAEPFILHNGKPYMYLFDGGYCFYSSSATSSSSHEYFYYTKDHLGNNRIVVSENGELKQVTHYYPFGGVYGDVCLNSGVQPYKYNGKEFDHTHGLNWYDYGARMYSPALPLWTSMDPMSEDYYSISPYIYCMNNPINAIDPDGKSTWVISLGNGKYKVVGGNLYDKDKNIYVCIRNEQNVLVPKRTIGITSSTTSFYNSDDGKWVNSIIDANDKSGNRFLSNIIGKNPPMFDDYIKNARHKKTYDFKVTNGTGMKYEEIEMNYRGMPIGVTDSGQTIYSSARDIGNIAAGYIAAVNGMTWKHSRMAFDMYESYSKLEFSMEGISTRNAEYYGWRLGYNNTDAVKK